MVGGDDDRPGVQPGFLENLLDVEAAVVGEQIDRDIRSPSPSLTERRKKLFQL